MARKLGIGCVLVIASALGCNAIAGIHEPVDSDAGSSGTAPDDAGTAPPDDTETGDGLDQFVGRWTTPAAMQTLTGCNLAGDLKPQPLTLVLSRGAASGTIVVHLDQAPLCRLNASVLGDQATLLPNQSCAFSFADGEIDTYTYTAPSTFTITPTDGNVANVHITARVFVTPQGDQCSFEEKSVYAREPL